VAEQLQALITAHADLQQQGKAEKARAEALMAEVTRLRQALRDVVRCM
jgi:hypothetical protein